MSPWPGGAEVQWRAGKYIIASYSATDGGPNLMNDWMAATSDTIDDAQLGQLTLDALETARREILVLPPPADLGLQRPTMLKMYKLAGVRSWKQFAAGTRAVSIKATDTDASITPMSNHGRWFGFITAEQLHVELTSNAIGRGVRLGLSKAT